MPTPRRPDGGRAQQTPRTSSNCSVGLCHHANQKQTFCPCEVPLEPFTHDGSHHTPTHTHTCRMARWVAKGSRIHPSTPRKNPLLRILYCASHTYSSCHVSLALLGWIATPEWAPTPNDAGGGGEHCYHSTSRAVQLPTVLRRSRTGVKRGTVVSLAGIHAE
jgi:hypothetical protein